MQSVIESREKAEELYENAIPDQMDAFNALHSITYEVDEKHNTGYHKNFINLK